MAVDVQEDTAYFFCVFDNRKTLNKANEPDTSRAVPAVWAIQGVHMCLCEIYCGASIESTLRNGFGR